MTTYLNDYLKSLGCELWPGEAFYLTDVKSRAAAEQWFRDFSNGFTDYIETQLEKDAY